MKKSRLVGIDYGMARIGLAYSDESKLIAMPLETLKTSKKSIETVKQLLDRLLALEEMHGFMVSEIVLGMPLMMSGKMGLLADEVQHFAALLKEHTSIPITFWDERLSSVQAERALREGNLSRKKRAQRSDAVAAVIILQNYLDFKRQKEKQEQP